MTCNGIETQMIFILKNTIKIMRNFKMITNITFLGILNIMLVAVYAIVVKDSLDVLLKDSDHYKIDITIKEKDYHMIDEKEIKDWKLNNSQFWKFYK